ncbi:DUF6538 domain-containing protein, partial [Roseateles sp. GG27B]
MKRTSNLKRRKHSTISSVRLYVPAWLQKAVGKKEVHRSTGCRDPRKAKIVIAEMVARWHAELDKYARMDLSKIVAGTLDLLGEGYILIDQAGHLLGIDHSALVTQLLARHARFYVYADNWDGWFLENMDLLWHDRDATGLVSVDISESELRKHAQQR